MKITKLTTFIVPPRWCFLKVETDQGVTGWGEPVVEGPRSYRCRRCPKNCPTPPDRQRPTQYRRYLDRALPRWFLPWRAVHMSALAGIDQALWDIKGKALGVSVSDLLGGQYGNILFFPMGDGLF